MSTVSKFVSSLTTSIKEYDWNKLCFRSLDRKKLYFAFSTMLHPVKAFDEIRFNNKGSVMIATVLFLLNFFIQIISYAGIGFIFNMNRPEEFKIWTELLKSNLLIALWCIANWATTTLLNGEGKFSHIWIVTNYALLPRIIFMPLLIGVSNIICAQEEMFYSLLSTLIYLWVLIVMFIGLIIVHQFSFMRTIASSIVSIIAIVFILFISLLFISIAQQVIMFGKTIFNEIILRM